MRSSSTANGSNAGAIVAAVRSSFRRARTGDGSYIAKAGIFAVPYAIAATSGFSRSPAAFRGILAAINPNALAGSLPASLIARC